MIRLIAWLMGITLGTLVVAGWLTLTETGNRYLVPLAEQALHTQLPNARITHLDIRLEHAYLHVALTPDTEFALNAQTDWWTQTIKANWTFNSKELAELEPLTEMPLSGKLIAQGQVDWQDTQGHADTILSLGISQLNIQLEQKPHHPLNIVTQGKLLLKELSQLLRQPQYADGTLSVNSRQTLRKLSDLNTLNGTTRLDIANGIAQADPINQTTSLSLPHNIPFNLSSRTDVIDGKTQSQVTINSALAHIALEELYYTIGNQDLTTKHKIHISDLRQLAFLTTTPLNGRLFIEGNAHYTLPTRFLIAQASSQTLGGEIDLSLHDKQLHLQLHDLQTTDICQLLDTPAIFQSSVTGHVLYDLQQQSGKFDARLYEGRFLPNTFAQQLAQHTKFDLTKELYEHAQLDGIIHHKVMTSNLDIKSRLTQLVTQQAVIDFNQQTIQADIAAQIQQTSIPLTIRGGISAPEMRVDLTEMASKQLEHSIQKEKQKITQPLPLINKR